MYAGVVPRIHVAFPQHDAIEGVPGIQREATGKPLIDDTDRAFILNVEETPPGRYGAEGARVRFMVAAPFRRRNPLDMRGRTNDRVLRDRIVVRPVQVVRPFVDLLRPRLDRLLAVHVGHAQRGENAHDLVHRDIAEVFGHDQIHQVVDVGKVCPGKGVDRHPPIPAERPDTPSGSFHVGLADIQALD